MTDNTYSGTLKFKDVDFVFVFDGSELVLIPPKERKNDIMWGWLKKEICPGVYTSGDPLTVDVPYLDGFCNETSKRLIFFNQGGIDCRKSKFDSVYQRCWVSGM